MLGILIGIPLGLLLVFTHRSTKNKSTPTKIAVGALAGIGIGVVINLVLEVTDLVGVIGK